MASARLKTTKDGREYYEIRVSMGRSATALSRRWYVPKGWSQKSIEQKLAKISAEFEHQCKAGEVKTRKQIRAEQEQAAIEESKILTLKDYTEKIFMPETARTRKEKTRENYQTILDRHILPVLGSYRMSEISKVQIKDTLLRLQEKGLKASTCKQVYLVVHTIFQRAFDDDFIDRNPVGKALSPKANKSEQKAEEDKAFTEEELIRIQECAENEPLSKKSLINLFIWTGCRKGEILGLKWDCIDFKENSITIKRNLCYTVQKGIYLDTPKNGKSRKIFVNQAVMNMLREHRASQKGNLLMLENNKNVPGFVFTQEGTDKPLFPSYIEKYFKRFEKKYGIEDFHPHKLRHSFASVAIRNGADIASISEILGHSNRSITLQIYDHANEESKKKASAIFSQALAANK